MSKANLGPSHDDAITASTARTNVQNLMTRNPLVAGQIGSGGLLVNKGGSITIQAPGTLNLGGGVLSVALSIMAGTTVTAGTNLIAGGDVDASGNANIGGAVILPNNTVISTYARAHSVVTGYVAAYLDAGGNLLSTPSSRRMKRDIEDAHWTPEQWRKIRTVHYRLRAAYILHGDDAETLAGVIGEEMLDLGLDEFVVLDDKGRVQTVHYELLALIALDAVQQLANQLDDIEKRLKKAGI